jgi:hypothetical protein
MRTFKLLFAIATTAAFASAGTVYTFTTIDVPGATNTIAWGLNDFGQVSGWYSFPPADGAGKSAENGFVLTGSAFSTFSYSGAYSTTAYGLNDNGVVAGLCQYEANGTSGTCQTVTGAAQGWVKNGGSYSLVADPNSMPNSTSAFAVNDSGQTVGVYEASNASLYAYELSGGVYTTLNPFNSTSSFAYGINDSGQVVGFYCANSACQQDGFLLSGGVYTSLSFPGAYNTEALGISNNGIVVGYYQLTQGGALTGFVYQDGVYTTIVDPLAAGRTQVTGVNNSGEISGIYLDSSGALDGFVASPAPTAPEPGTMGMVLLGAASAWVCRQKLMPRRVS